LRPLSHLVHSSSAVPSRRLWSVTASGSSRRRARMSSTARDVGGWLNAPVHAGRFKKKKKKKKKKVVVRGDEGARGPSRDRCRAQRVTRRDVCHAIGADGPARARREVADGATWNRMTHRCLRRGAHRRWCSKAPTTLGTAPVVLVARLSPPRPAGLSLTSKGTSARGFPRRGARRDQTLLLRVPEPSSTKVRLW